MSERGIKKLKIKIDSQLLFNHDSYSLITCDQLHQKKISCVGNTFVSKSRLALVTATVSLLFFFFNLSYCCILLGEGTSSTIYVVRKLAFLSSTAEILFLPL